MSRWPIHSGCCMLQGAEHTSSGSVSDSGSGSSDSDSSAESEPEASGAQAQGASSSGRDEDAGQRAAAGDTLLGCHSVRSQP